MSISEKYNLSALPEEWAVRLGEARDSNHPRVDEFMNLYSLLSKPSNWAYDGKYYGYCRVLGYTSIEDELPAPISLDEFFAIIDKKEWMPKYGEPIKVSDGEDNWVYSFFLAYVKGATTPWIVVHKMDGQSFLCGQSFNIQLASYAKPLSQITTLTKAEIAEKLGIPVESLIITD